mmetsp:Transcript_3309/g.4197  ORF Transcript_3309/g.4197 Transcript_3309/m.4197 type:complete len:213 (-) Transcript_3309:270-908(-)
MENAPEGAGPIFTIGSISPVYYNNPSFRAIEYDGATGRPMGIHVYFSDMAETIQELEWQKAYSFPEDYNLDMNATEIMTNTGMKQLQANLLAGFDTWNMYSQWYKTNYSNDLQEYGVDPEKETTLTEEQRAHARLMYVCATKLFVNSFEFDNCYNRIKTSLNMGLDLATSYTRTSDSSTSLKKAREGRDFRLFYQLSRNQRRAEIFNFKVKT